jgi:hypothetical protein
METTFIDEEWQYVLNMLPADLEESAADKLALTRRRQVGSAEDLLRLCLAYGLCDMSLRQTAAWAHVIGLGELSDVAVLKRIQGAADWLGHLIWQWMQDRGLQAPDIKDIVRIVDATVVCQPGSTGTDWRLHLGLDLEQLRICSVEVTGPEGGETFLRHQAGAGEIIVGDRGYAQRAGVASVLDQDAHALVRTNWQNFPLLSTRGKSLDIVQILQLLGPGEIGDWPVSFEYEKRSYPMRLIAIRKSADAAEKERKRIHHEAQRKGKKPHPKSLQAAEFIYLLTDMNAEMLPPAEALDLYRLRWQIEIFFKRLKGVMRLKNLRARNEHLARAYLYSKILGALIVDELRHEALSFFPWGYPLRPQACQRLAHVPDHD